MASLISLGQVIDKTIAHYRKHFVELLSITTWIVIASVPAAAAKILQPYTAGTEPTPLHIFYLVLSYSGAILLAVVSTWVLLSIIIAVAEEASGTTRDQKAQGKKAWKLFFSYVWVSILVSLVMALILVPPFLGLVLIIIDAARNTSTVLSSIGGVLLFVGALVSFILLVKYSIQYGFAPYSLVLENEHGVKALQHSATLVSGRWWGTFFRFVVPKLIYALVVFVLNFLLLAVLAILLIVLLGEGQLYQGIGNATWLILSSVVTALSLPLIAVTDFYIYDSLRTTRS
ncbi:MAG: hypothetical protein WC813_03305 [Patescibacteria group bacterium]|jgi:hypothetical protein